jgi:hypothetical protein
VTTRQAAARVPVSFIAVDAFGVGQVLLVTLYPQEGTDPIERNRTFR